MKRSMELLPQVSFSILMALSLRPRHGYEIMQQVSEDSLGKIKLAPGTLYGAIKQLMLDELIEEVESDSDEPHAQSRRYYRLTKAGWDRFNTELGYFNNVVKLSRHRTAHET